MEEIQKKSDADLKEYIAEKRGELRTLRFTGSGSGVRNTKAAGNLKKEIARSLTELNKRNNEVANDA